jgi:hypothetical protein
MAYLSDDPAEGERGVRTGEDVLVHADYQLLSSYPHASQSCHPPISPSTADQIPLRSTNETNLQKTPDEILKLPVRPDTSHLEHHHTVILEQIIHFLQEFSIVADTDVLGHLEARNLVERLTGGDVAVVFA